MAIASTVIFEVETGGSDNNGGGYVSGGGGTDRSQQTAAQVAFNGTTITAHTAAATATIIHTGYTATAADVGNLLQITGGTNATAGIYQIISQAGTTWTLDRNCCTGAMAGMTGNMGGCFATIGKAVAQMILSGMITYVKGGTNYSISTGISTPAGSSIGSGICRIIGYTTTRGDNGMPTILTTAAINAYTDGQGGFSLENFILDGNSLTGSTGVVLSSACTAVYNCLIKNFSSGAASMTGAQSQITQSTLQGCGSGILSSQTGGLIKNNRITACTGVAITIIGQGVNIIDNVIDANTGASTDGIQYSAAYSYVKGIVTGNYFKSNGRDGINSSGSYNINEISNNIFDSNGRYGLNLGLATAIADPRVHHNAYYNNTTARNGSLAGVGDVTLTGSPATSSSNFALNNTAGAGKACRAAGYAGILQSGGTGYRDIGPLQHPDPSSFFNTQGQTGGFNG